MNLKHIAMAVSVGLTMAQAPYVSAATDTATQLTSEKDKVSYTIGVDMGDNFRAQGIEINPDALAQGVKDGVAGGDTLLTKEQMEETLLNFQKELLAEREQKLKEAAAENLAIGTKFLAANKAKPGVVTLPSGLQYKVIKEGSGNKPTAEDMVTVNYTGYLVDLDKEDGLGKIFDSSTTRDKPVTFPVSGVIPGWTQALQLMNAGSEWFIYVPANLAYGEHAIGPIGPNETLIFKIDLISTQAAADEENSTGDENTNEQNAKQQTATDKSAS